MGDEYTERKIRVYNIKKKDGNPVVKGAKAVVKGFMNFAETGDTAKRRRVEA